MASARRRNISVVLFDVVFESRDQRVTLPSAMKQFFANTEAVQLRHDTKAKYQSGNYRRHGAVWTGEIERQVEAQRTHVSHDSEAGYRMQRSAKGRGVLTADKIAAFAFHEGTGVFLMQERAEIPYTRVRSYVRKAHLAAVHQLPSYGGVELDLVPRTVTKSVREWIQYLTEIHMISMTFTHSQSPGNESVDMIFDELDAAEMRQTVQAHNRGKLKKRALLDRTAENPVSQAVDHIAANPDNGEAVLKGLVEEEPIFIRTKSAVDRRLVPVVGDSIADALVRYCNTVSEDGNGD
jgi:hypothetical protein